MITLMEVNHQILAGVLIQRSYMYDNETGGITSLFRLNVVKDCTLVSVNHALLRLIITPVSLDITQVSLLLLPQRVSLKRTSEAAL